MPRIRGTSNAQSKFLRAFRDEPFGPPVQAWPSAAIMRRWLRRPGFVAAMRSLRTAMRAQADLQLLSAAAAASHMLHSTLTASGENEDLRPKVKPLTDLLKLSHTRERFAADNDALPKVPIRDSQVLGVLHTIHPNQTVEFARQAIADYQNDRGLFSIFNDEEKE